MTTPAPTRRPGRPTTGGPGSRGGMTKQKAVRLTDAQIADLERRAAAADTSVSTLIQRAVTAWLAVQP